MQRPLKWENVVTFASPAAKSFAFRVVSGQTLELVIAQFWASGIGSHGTASVDFEVKNSCLKMSLFSPPDIWIAFAVSYNKLNLPSF